MFYLYNLFIAVLFPIWLIRILFRTAHQKQFQNWKEFCGVYDIPFKTKKRIWMHAVSLGEVIGSIPIVKAIKEQYPDVEVIVTSTTADGYQAAKNQHGKLFDYVFYFPLDVLRFQTNAMAAVRPDIVVIMETEFWLNFLWSAQTFGAKTILVNGRVCDKVFRDAKKARAFYSAIFSHIDMTLARTQLDAERLTYLGAKEAQHIGDCKFDQALPSSSEAQVDWKSLIGEIGQKLVVVVGSTRSPFEEQFVLDAIQKVGLDKIAVIHAPRNLARVIPLEKEIIKRFGECGKRSLNQFKSYTLLDTYGELASLYSICDLAIVGGGFQRQGGGQNFLQPLGMGKPVLYGANMRNWQTISDLALARQCSISCATSDDLAQAIQKLIESPKIRIEMSEAGKKLIQENIGASKRYADQIVLQLNQVKAEKQSVLFPKS
jgi:3-deoxy-D-manno-octulosonic-acid transferase